MDFSKVEGDASRLREKWADGISSRFCPTTSALVYASGQVVSQRVPVVCMRPHAPASSLTTRDRLVYVQIYEYGRLHCGRGERQSSRVHCAEICAAGCTHDEKYDVWNHNVRRTDRKKSRRHLMEKKRQELWIEQQAGDCNNWGLWSVKSGSERVMLRLHQGCTHYHAGLLPIRITRIAQMKRDMACR